jgi:putative tryptophan/tyrosine transport system substrate-binding protein
MRRREFIRFLGVTALSAWPLIVRGQQSSLPVVGFVDVGSVDASASRSAAFRRGLNEAGYTEGQNVMVEYHWLEGRYDRAAAVMTDLVRRRVAVIATPVTVTALAARAATKTIPIVFGTGDDPVQLGLVASLARPGGNTTGINIFVMEVIAKRLRLLHDLLPKATRVRQNSGRLRGSRHGLSRRFDELRNRRRRYVPSSRRLYRQHSQGGQAWRIACFAIEQI